MKYRRLGTAGVKVSEVSLGNWLTHSFGIENERAAACTKAAFDLGINFFDTANVYNRGGAEEFWGKELKQFRRDDLVLATKVFFPMSDNVNDRGLSRKNITRGVEASLRRLQTDYIDLYQCHRYDSEVPVFEVVRAMDDLIRQGKITYWGVSEWPALQIKNACEIARTLGACPPVSNQPEYSIAARRLETNGVQSACLQEGMGMVIWSPLKQGVLTGKYSGGKKPAGTRGADAKMSGFFPDLTTDLPHKVDQLRPIAEKHRISLAQLALAWLLHRDAVSSVIIGATKPEQVKENAAAIDVGLTQEDLEKIDSIFPAANWPG
ncbi:MAG: aldo/keto reductase family protein [Phycisphaerae bacterium]